MSLFTHIRNFSSLYILILFILSGLVIFFTYCEQPKEANELQFPRDEGRHYGLNESWYIFFNLTSEKGNRYCFHTHYLKQKEKNGLHKICSFTNLSNQTYYFKTDHIDSDYLLDSSKLNITYDSYFHTDRWYQLENKDFQYYFCSGFKDYSGQKIVLNCTLTSKKLPVILNSSLLNKVIFEDESNELYYYTQSNILVNGMMLINNNKISVSGSAWIDREWGGQLMSEIEWFAIQLDNDYEITASKINKELGNTALGFLITPKGDMIDISKYIEINTLNYTEKGYSNKWTVSSKDGLFDLIIQTHVDNQIIKGWPNSHIFEGGCEVTGVFQSNQVKGFCFSEQKQ